MDDLPYLSFSRYIKNRFGKAVYKLPVDAGFSCPNIDGTKGTGGCSYCRNSAFTPGYTRQVEGINRQIERGKEILKERGVRDYFIYFQAHTNSYAPVERLQELYSMALAHAGVVGLCIGTRPDCIDPALARLLGGYGADGYEIWVELGQQTVHDRTLERLNRGHGFAEYCAAVELLQGRPGIKLCPHLIFGLPGEDREMMLESVTELGARGMDGVKFHHLQIIRGTQLEASFTGGEYSPLSYHEYRDLLVKALRLLPPGTVVHRLMSEAPGELLVAPRWKQSKHQLVREIRAIFSRQTGEPAD